MKTAHSKYIRSMSCLEHKSIMDFGSTGYGLVRKRVRFLESHWASRLARALLLGKKTDIG